MLICGTPKGILMLKRLEKILNGFYTTQVWTKVELCGSCYLRNLCERNGLKALIL